MKKTYLRYFLLTIFFTFFLVRPSYALLDGFISGCLTDAGWTPSHTATLTIQKGGVSVPAISTDTWVFVCITRGTDSYCTTGGDGSIDKDLFGSDSHFQTLKTMTGEGGYVGGVQTGHNPSQTNDDAGNVQFNEQIVWGDAYYPVVLHQWSWVQKAPPIEANGEGGAQGALQQGSLIFERISTETKKCVPIGWDPRGVVFDTNTFFPVKNIKVELYKENETSHLFEFVSNQLGITNPFTTSVTNGQYSFFVGSGLYKLKINDPSIAIAQLSDSQREVAHTLFADAHGEDHIYTEEAIVREELGVVEIANIPVAAADESLLVKDLSIIDNVPPSSEGNELLLFGRVSHPRTKMIIEMNMLNEKGEQKKFIKTDFTDGLGEYKKHILQTVASEEPLVFDGATLSFELNSFYTTGVFTQKTEGWASIIALFLKKIDSFILNKWSTLAATHAATSLTIKPIPAYIDGIAYGTQGEILPNALVEIYPFYSNKPMYTTIADEKGRFKVGSQHLPQTQYKLRYVKSTGEAVTLDTSVFIKQNAPFILTQNIKLFEPKNTTFKEDLIVQEKLKEKAPPIDINSPMNRTSQKTSFQNNNSSPNRNTTTTQSVQQGSSAGMQGVTMIIVVILVLFFIAAGTFIMMKSRKQTAPW